MPDNHFQWQKIKSAILAGGVDVKEMDKTFYVQIKKKRLLTNLKMNNIYPRQRLIDEFSSIIAELEKQPDNVFLVDFIPSPFFCLTITSYKEMEK